MTAKHKKVDQDIESSCGDFRSRQIGRIATEIGDGDHYHDQAIWDICQLEALEATTSNPYVSQHVRGLLEEVSYQADLAIARVRNPPTEHPKRSWLDRVLVWFADRRVTKLGRRWGEIALVITALICAATVAGYLWMAFALLLVRLGGTFIVGGGPYALLPPFSIGHSGVVKISRVDGVSRAILSSTGSHIADIAMLASMSIYLYFLGEVSSAMLLVVSVSLVATGSFARIAPSQVGQIVSQSPWERVFRLGGFCLALLAALFAPRVFGLHQLVLAGLAAGGYGIWEIASSVRFLTKPSNHLSSVRIRATRSDGSPTEFFVAPESRAEAALMRLRQTG